MDLEEGKKGAICQKCRVLLDSEFEVVDGVPEDLGLREGDEVGAGHTRDAPRQAGAVAGGVAQQSGKVRGNGRS